MQQFKRIAFALAREAVCRKRRTHRGHEATEQEHHVAFHALHNLYTVTRNCNRLRCRQNRRRDDEGNPETRFPENQAKFVFEDVEHWLGFRGQVSGVRMVLAVNKIRRFNRKIVNHRELGKICCTTSTFCIIYLPN